MKRLLVLLAIGCCYAASGYADCENEGYVTQLKNDNPPKSMADALDDKRILAKTLDDSEEWNEDHCSNGALYKVGVSPTDPVDPRAYRGQWSAEGQGAKSVVVYDYGGPGVTYRWTLWEDASGGLCWEDENNNVVAIAPLPLGIPGGLTCALPVP
jgi:hypothetical protein